jgi:thiol-disulfide isomerase/thioredoxin
MNSAPFGFALLALTLLARANAGDAGPKVGDTAPELHVREWIQGEPVGHFEHGRVYVIEFWATWCGPCIFAMPHLSEVQRQYRDKNVTVIAVDVLEDDVNAAKALIKTLGKKVENRVAIDENTTSQQAGATARAWLGANREIPRCAIVDRDAKVAWIGHPMRVDGPLHAIVSGTYDAAQQSLIDEQFEVLDRQLGAAKRDKQWGKVLEILDQMHVADPFSTPLNHTTRIQALLGQRDYESANRFVKQVLTDSSDLKLMGELAGALLTAPDKSKLDLDFVLEAANTATHNGESDDPVALSALARAFEARGEKAASIKVWTKMLELDDPLIEKDGLRARIDQLRTH